MVRKMEEKLAILEDSPLDGCDTIDDFFSAVFDDVSAFDILFPLSMGCRDQFFCMPDVTALTTFKPFIVKMIKISLDIDVVGNYVVDDQQWR